MSLEVNMKLRCLRAFSGGQIRPLCRAGQKGNRCESCTIPSLYLGSARPEVKPLGNREGGRSAWIHKPGNLPPFDAEAEMRPLTTGNWSCRNRCEAAARFCCAYPVALPCGEGVFLLSGEAFPDPLEVDEHEEASGPACIACPGIGPSGRLRPARGQRAHACAHRCADCAAYAGADGGAYARAYARTYAGVHRCGDAGTDGGAYSRAYA